MAFDDFSLSGPPQTPGVPDDLDTVQLHKLAGGGAAGMGLPSFAELSARMGQNAMRDPAFLRSYFQNVPRSAMEDQGYLNYARTQALGRGRSLQGRGHWWDDPNQLYQSGYQSMLNDRAAQSRYFMDTYGFDPITGQVANPMDQGFMSAAAEYGRRQAEAQRGAGMLGTAYGNQFSLQNEPGTGGLPYGYRRYVDEFGNAFLVDGRGNIVR